MFQLYYDTRSEALAATLARLLAEAGGDNPLTPRTVLVPQLGLERWLTRTLAEQYGIAANIEFIAPAQFAWRLLRAWRELAPRSPFDRELLQWRLFELLPRVAVNNVELAAMLPADAAPLRRLQLAGRFAQLFERYQAYRPEKLADWAAGRDIDDAQGELWQQLVAGADEPPRSRLMADYVRHFGAEGAAAPPGLPAQLFAYGCINVSPQVLALLGMAARHAELHFLMPTPCGAYWGDLPPRHAVLDYIDDLGHFMGGAEPNRLLVSLGGVGREFVRRVFDMDAVQMPDADHIPAAPARDTLLARVQADVTELVQPGPPAAGADKRPEAPDPHDNSLTVQVCHSALREVQVLHDHLLDLLQHNHDLEARDIVVMMPRVSDYAASVEAVFGAIDRDDVRFLPWTIADRPAADAHPITALVTRLLALPATRLTLDFVLEVLEVPAALRQAELEPADIEALAARARAAGIRWGEDGADREAEGLPAFDDFSWSFGRRRLLLGYLLGDDDDQALVEGIAPEADIEAASARAFGALTRLQRQLHALKRAMHKPRPARDWQDLFNTHLGRMLRVDSDDRAASRALADVRQALADVAEDSAAAGADDLLDWACLREILADKLAASRPGQRFMDGGVSVCSMVPMRDVPFKMVCVLGLDAASFPHRDDADVLSLIRQDAEHGKRILGDRSVREDDRYLFLQTIMAARRQLYLSYTGIDMKTGRKREPSVLLAELIEHVCNGYFQNTKKAREALVTLQPMQPFSPRLFVRSEDEAAKPQVFSYRHEWREAAGQRADEVAPAAFIDTALAAPDDAPELDLAELKRFFGGPQKYYLQRRVRLAMPDIDEEAGREPLVLQGLDSWRLQQRMVPGLLVETDSDTLEARLRAQALLPPLAMGRQAYADGCADIAPQTDAWRHWAGVAGLPGARQLVELGLGDGRTLRGAIAGICDAGFGAWVGKHGNHKRWFEWWLDALVYRAAVDSAGECRAFGINHEHQQPELPASVAMPHRREARRLLLGLVELMRDGLREPLLLPPKSGFAMGKALVTGPGPRSPEQDPDKFALAAARKVWDGGQWPESDDPWLRLTMRGRGPFDDALACIEQARQIYVPLWRALLKEGDDDNA